VPSAKNPQFYFDEAHKRLVESFNIYTSLKEDEPIGNQGPTEREKLRKAAEDIQIAISQGIAVMEDMKKRLRKRGAELNDSAVAEMDAKLSSALLLGGALNYEDPDLEFSLSALCGRMHPSRRLIFKHVFLGVLIYSAAVHGDVEGARNFYRKLLSLRPGEHPGREYELAATRLVTAYNMVFLFHSLKDPASAMPFLKDLEEAAVFFHKFSPELIPKGGTPDTGVSPDKEDGYHLSLPIPPFNNASIFPDEKAGAAAPAAPSPGPAKPGLAGLMRRAAGLNRPEEARRRTPSGRAKDRAPRERPPKEPVSAPQLTNPLIVANANVFVNLFFAACEMTMEDFMDRARLAEAEEIFPAMERLSRPENAGDSLRLAYFISEIVSHAPQDVSLDALLARVLNAAGSRLKAAPVAREIFAQAARLFFRRFEKRKGNPEILLPLFQKLMALPTEDGIREIRKRAAVSLFQALGGFKGDGSSTFPGPVLPEDKLQSLRSVYQALRDREESLPDGSAWRALGLELLCSALAAENRELTEEILKDLESRKDSSGSAETCRLLAQAAICVHRSRAGRVPEAKEHLALLESRRPLPKIVLPAWGFALTELSLALAREGRPEEAKKMAESVLRHRDDEGVKTIARPLKEILGELPWEDPGDGDRPLFRLLN
jgi:tetratricopeptide (TPR) repeat protein